MTAESNFTAREFKILPPRFRTYEDAMLYQTCLQNRTEFPKEKWLWPFVMGEDGSAIVNPEYRDAPYQCSIITLHEDKNDTPISTCP